SSLLRPRPGSRTLLTLTVHVLDADLGTLCDEALSPCPYLSASRFAVTAVTKPSLNLSIGAGSRRCLHRCDGFLLNLFIGVLEADLGTLGEGNHSGRGTGRKLARLP